MPHRRIPLGDVLAFKQANRAEHRAIAAELTAEVQELGVRVQVIPAAVYDANVLYPSALRDFLTGRPTGVRWNRGDGGEPGRIRAARDEG